MEKENPKTVKAVPATDKIDSELPPAIVMAIKEIVSAAMSELIKSSAPVPLAPQTLPAPSNAVIPPLVQAGYVSKLKGIPVQPGQDLRHVHPQEIKNWFAAIENRWKESYDRRQVGGQPVSLTLGRG